MAANNIKILRNLVSELRRSSTGPLKENYMYQYIMGQFRKYQTTEQQICKAHEEMNFLAQTYLCYLKSTRLQQAINEEYLGKGERTVAETASMVGFKLPHDPK